MSNSIAMEVECCDFDEDIMPKKNINELPDEVLEYIFSLVSPYRDLKECMLVCKRWLETVKNVSRLLTLKLTNAINSMDVAWQAITPVEMAPTITKRYSHSACYHENSMYVFGGCTSTSTTFNDLWRLDLNKRQWVRPLTMGTYPSPKACATMVRYKDALIVFGGWTSPSPYPLHQTWRFFNELHIYCILKNRWMCINTAVSPPGMAGHSATVHGNKMIVFGGLRAEVHGQYSSCNDVWCFNLEKEEWSKQPTTEVKPHNRYGQSQISLGTDYLLILGGCGGPNMVFNDVWLLSMTGDTWEWREVQVQNKEWSAAHMWCHRACRVGNYVVMMSRDPRPLKRKPQNILKNKVKPRPSSVWFPPKYEESMPGIPQRIYPTVQQIDRDSNVNGQRGTFNRPNWNQINSVQGLENDVAIDTASDESGCSHTKRMKNTQPKGCVETDSKPGPSGLSNLSPARANSLDDRQPGPSGVGKEGGSAGVGPNQAKNEVQDGPNANSPYWDRLRPISRPPSGIHLAAFQDQEQAARTCPSRARERQLLALQRVEERMRMNNLVRARAQEPSDGEEVSPAKLQRTMVLCVLDITNVLEEECSVRWLSSSESFSSGPEETLLYSLVVGRGELIMFGGIHREAMTLMTNSHVNPRSTTLSNSLHFISAPFGVI